MTVIRGGDDPLDQEVLSGIIHALLFAYQICFSWEWTLRRAADDDVNMLYTCCAQVVNGFKHVVNML